MKTMHPLEERERLQHPVKARRFVWLFVLGGLLVLAGDWYLRFERYEWGRSFISYPIGPPTTVDQHRPLFRTNYVPETRGGDLTGLLGIRDLADRFAEPRPAHKMVVDRYGYNNRLYDPDIPFDIVVVGDSFMASGTLETQFSSRLSDRLGRFVYNHSLRGHGPFISIYRFIDAARFIRHPPDVLIWGFAERELGGHAFAGMVYQLDTRREEGNETADDIDLSFNKPRIYWKAMTPQLLRKSLPNSSILAHVGQWIWNRARYLLFRQGNPDVVISTKDFGGESMLFYRYHVEAIAREWEPYPLKQVEWGFEYLRDYLSARGIELVVVLIPEKEQVYREAIPPRLNVPDRAELPSVLWTVEDILKELGIPSVNLLPPFLEAAEKGEWLYWRDDTHWNSQGIEIAAERVESLLAEIDPLTRE